MFSMFKSFIWINLIRCLLSKWPSSTSTLPTPDYGFAVGSFNRTITIIGGYTRPTGLTTYSIDSDTFTQQDIASTPLTVDISGISQFWAQHQDTVYMVSDQDTTIVSSFNLQSQVFTAAFVSIDEDVGPHACLASSSGYLYIVGGAVTVGTTGFDTLQILDLSTDTWLLGGPTMTTPRAGLTCVVHGSNLWALGGYHGGFLATTETISIRNIISNVWDSSATPELLDSALYSRATSYKDWIFIVAGSQGTILTNSVQIINTRLVDVDGIPTVTEETLPYNVDSAGVIYYDSIVYGFGGRSKVTDPVEAIDSFLFFDTHTPDPTRNPSKFPTRYPSKQPSGMPTKSPTDEPTTAPSPIPTRAPTNATLQPSWAPTRFQTTVFFTDYKIPPRNNNGNAEAALQERNLLYGLIATCGVLIVVLIVAGVMWKKKKDSRFQQEKQVQDMVMGELEEEHQKQVDYLNQIEAVKTQQDNLGCSEADVMRQVMALSAFEAQMSARRASLQAMDSPRAKKVVTNTMEPVKEDEQRESAEDKAKEDTDKAKQDTDKAKTKEEDKAADKQSDALLSGKEDKKEMTGLVVADSDDEDGGAAANKEDVALEMISMAAMPDTADDAKTADKDKKKEDKEKDTGADVAGDEVIEVTTEVTKDDAGAKVNEESGQKEEEKPKENEANPDEDK